MSFYSILHALFSVMIIASTCCAIVALAIRVMAENPETLRKADKAIQWSVALMVTFITIRAIVLSAIG